MRPLPSTGITGFRGTTSLSDSRLGYTPPYGVEGRDSLASPGLPRCLRCPSPRAVPTTPVGRDGCVCRLLPPRAAAFPSLQGGRRPPRYFRGLLRIHSRYGPRICSRAFRPLLSRGFGARLLPRRSVAMELNRQLPQRNSHPLDTSAFVAHCRDSLGSPIDFGTALYEDSNDGWGFDQNSSQTQPRGLHVLAVHETFFAGRPLGYRPLVRAARLSARPHFGPAKPCPTRRRPYLYRYRTARELRLKALVSGKFGGRAATGALPSHHRDWCRTDSASTASIVRRDLIGAQRSATPRPPANDRGSS